VLLLLKALWELLPVSIVGGLTGVLFFCGLNDKYACFQTFRSKKNPWSSNAILLDNYIGICFVYLLAGMVATLLQGAFGVGVRVEGIQRTYVMTIMIVGVVRFLTITWSEGVTNALVLWLHAGIASFMYLILCGGGYYETFKQTVADEYDFQRFLVIAVLGTPVMVVIVEFLIGGWKKYRANGLENSGAGSVDR